MSSPGKISKRKSKPYFNRASSSRKHCIEVGSRGFLCSCNFREKDCIREAYNILNQYSEQPGSASEEQEQNDAEEDVSESLDKEIDALKKDRQSDRKTFQAVESGAKNLVFIRTTLEDPVKLAHSIVSDTHEKQLQQTRYLLRLVPIEIVCKATNEEILKHFATLALKHLSEQAVTFAIVFNHRNNNDLSKDDLIKSLADKVFEVRSDHKVDLKNAQVSILVEVIRSFAFLAVVPDYIKYKKYNMLSVTGQEEEKSK